MRPLHQDEPFSYERIDKPIVILLRDTGFYIQISSGFTKLLSVGSPLMYREVKCTDRIYTFNNETEVASAFDGRCLEKYRHKMSEKEYTRKENFEAIKKELKEGKYVGWLYSGMKHINKLDTSFDKINVFRCVNGKSEGYWNSSNYPSIHTEFCVFDNEFEFWAWAHAK